MLENNEFKYDIDNIMIDEIYENDFINLNDDLLHIWLKILLFKFKK